MALLNTSLRKLMFVDDEPRVLQAIERSLRGADPTWTFRFVNSVDEAFKCLATEAIDVIVTDVTMPQRDGFSLLREVTKNPAWQHIPVVVLTGIADRDLKRRALDAGAFDLIAKPVQREDLVARLRSVLRTKDDRDALERLNTTLEQQVMHRTLQLESSRNDILVCLAMAGECRDVETGRHVIRVARYTRRLAEELGLDPKTVQALFKTSPLHDLGKIGVPDHILRKVGPLTIDERAIMQTHCIIGHRILSTPTSLGAGLTDRPQEPVENPLISTAAEIAMYHHERWDGAGYPQRVAGDAIPLSARIVAVADVYDALTTVRPYKKALPHARALEIILSDSGTHFDPSVITALMRCSEEFDAIRSDWSDLQDVGSAGGAASPRRLAS